MRLFKCIATMFTLLSRATWYISSCIQTNWIRVDWGRGGGVPVFQISDIRIPAYTEYNNHVNTEITMHFLLSNHQARPGAGKWL